MEPGNLDVTRCSFWSQNLSPKPTVSPQKWKPCHTQGKESDAFSSVPTGGSLSLHLNLLVPSRPTPLTRPLGSCWGHGPLSLAL